MKKRFFISLFMITMLFLSSCDLDDGSNFQFTPLRIISAEVPEAFELNETFVIKVTYLRPDDCTFFEGFDVSRTDMTTRNVVVIGTLLTEQDDCVEIAQEVETSFDFEVRYQDPYLFRFWTGENEAGEPQFLEIEVPVN